MNYNPNWHGFAQQSNFVEVAPSGAGGYPSEANLGTKLTDKHFAQVVWNIGPAIPGSSQDIPASALSIVETYIDGTDSYVCEAPIGSALGDSVWRISLISTNGSGGATVRYAQAGANNLAATDLATVKAYTYS